GDQRKDQRHADKNDNEWVRIRRHRMPTGLPITFVKRLAMRHPAKESAAASMLRFVRRWLPDQAWLGRRNPRRHCTNHREKLFPGLRRFSAEPSAPLWFGFLGWRGRRFLR